MNSFVSMVMPEEGTISCPSFRHVMRMGMSPDDTTQAMYINLPMEVGGKSNGWISGGTERGRGGEDERVSKRGEGMRVMECKMCREEGGVNRNVAETKHLRGK